MVSERGIIPGTILYDNYVIESVLGEGGFGITYQAVKEDTGETVAIKEYFPYQLAIRKRESGRITVREPKKMKDYIRGKERFIREASILKEYRYLEGIVKVWEYFETNNTAYIVMDYIDGITLKEYVEGHGGLDYEELLDMLSPILKSLITLHRHGVIHRDISPDNLMIGMDNCLYLLDFGAAKEMENGKPITVLLKAGYAPPEQYLPDGELGAWTDVYGICATIYTALCGQVPTDAVARLQGKELVPISQYGIELPDWQWNALEKGMRIRAAERFRDVGKLYDALTIEQSYEDIHTVLKNNPKTHNRTRWIRAAVLFIGIFIAVAAYGGSHWWIQTTTAQQNVDNHLEENEVVPTETEETGQTAKQPKLCRMPDVVGLTEQSARTSITQIDGMITIRTIRAYDKEFKAGVVMEQNVEPDTQYNEGAIKEIILTVSDGTEPTTERKSSAKKQRGTQNNDYDVQSDGNEAVDFYLDD